MSHDEATALALTPWGSSTLDALQCSTEAQREEIARRACEDAVADARDMAGLQGSLFEKLLVIERFGLYRACGHESIQEFLEKAVAPVVQMHRGTLYRLKDAVWEAGRLLQQYGTVKADWSHLSLLAGETRRREKGQGALAPEAYESLSRQVAEGAVSHRDLAAALQRPERRAGEKRVRNVAKAVRPSPPRPATPFEELARITAEIRRPAPRAAVDLGPTMAQAEQLLVHLERLSLHPADLLAVPPVELDRFRRLLLELGRAVSSAAELARQPEAA